MYRPAFLVLLLVWALVLPAPSVVLAQPIDAEPVPRQATPEPTRLAGPDRVATAAALSRTAWPASDDVVLASAANFPDALTGGALAERLDAPLLLTAPDALSSATRTEIARLDASKVVVLGGTAAISSAVTNTLTGLGLTVDRIAGIDRYDTAARIAARLGDFEEAAVVNGETFADAVTAGALLAGPDVVPILLTRKDALPAVTAQTLAAAGTTTVDVVGGTAAVSAAVEATLTQRDLDVQRLGGPTRYATAAIVAGEALSRLTAPALELVLATGADFPDALAAGPFAARIGGLLLVTPRAGLTGAPEVSRLAGLSMTRFDRAYLVGGPAAIVDGGGLAGASARGAVALQRSAEINGLPGSAAAATVEPLATQTALGVLADGGNAIDATIAAAAVLGVAEPFSCGIGGGGFMVIRSAAENRVVTIDGREEAPAAYFPTVFIDPETDEPIPFAERVTSGLGVGVPGTLDTWQVALDRYGSRNLDELLGPAIEAADYGIPVDETFAVQSADNADRFALFEPTAELYLPHDGQPRAEGEWFRNPDLATTYREIASQGSDAFYQGDLAGDIVDAVRTPPLAVDDPPAPVRPGLMVEDDVNDYEARVQEPTVTSYRGLEVYGMGLPSSGGLTIGLALNQLEATDDTLGPIPPGDDEELFHRFLESISLAWADRNAYMGDSAFVDVPEEGLSSQAYATERAELIGETFAERPFPPGDPFAFQGGPAAPAGPAAAVSSSVTGSTTHLNVSDNLGNVVSYTFTIEQIGGSGIVVPDRGFLLNNELTDFDPEPPHPNAPDGNKRPRSSMSPTIVTEGDDVVMSLGTPGGATIITTVTQILLAVVDGWQSLADAVAAPRVANFNSESNFAETAFVLSEVARALEDRDHTFTDIGEIGAASGIAFGSDGIVTAVAEPVRRGAGDAGVVAAP